MKAKILTAYYSRTGSTERIARLIHQQVGGTLYQIIPETPYPRDYRDTVNQAKQEIKTGYRPPLQKSLSTHDAFDLICIGSPNWWSTIAPPVATFLSTLDLSGKTVAPFCTHGGGGLGHIKEDIAGLCPGATILACLGIYGSGGSSAQQDVTTWLSRLGVID